MINKIDFLKNINLILRDLNYVYEESPIDDKFYLGRFSINNREVHLIFNKEDGLVKWYLLNTSTEIPDYKNTHLCFSLEMLDILSGTSERNSKLYWGDNRPDGMYRLTSDQMLKNQVDLIQDNYKLFASDKWMHKSIIDEKYSEKMGYKTEVGWKPDAHLAGIINKLSFLEEKGFTIIHNDNNLPEYESGFQWEKYLVYENAELKTRLEIMIDYRGQSDFMRTVTNGNTSPYEEFNSEKIRKHILKNNS